MRLERQLTNDKYQRAPSPLADTQARVSADGIGKIVTIRLVTELRYSYKIRIDQTELDILIEQLQHMQQYLASCKSLEG